MGILFRRWMMVGLGLVCSAPIVLAAENRGTHHYSIPDNVEVKKNLTYGKGDSVALKLDLFLPRKSKGKRPAIVFIHGGGWKEGGRDRFYKPAAELASRGYVGACIDYRLSGQAPFPAALEDCKCAVRWLRANAETYHIDADRIIACGASAGGHLAAMLGVTSGVKEFEGSGGNAEYSSQVCLVVDCYGPSDLTGLARNPRAARPVAQFLGATAEDDPEVYRKASPITYVDRHAPPFLILHGTADEMVPFEQSVLLLKKLRAANVSAKLDKVEDAPHSFFEPRSAYYQASFRDVASFLDAFCHPKRERQP